MEVGETFASAARSAHNTDTSAAVLVSQHIIGFKDFSEEPT